MRTRPDADLMHKVGSKGIRDVIAPEQALTRNTLKRKEINAQVKKKLNLLIKLNVVKYLICLRQNQ